MLPGEQERDDAIRRVGGHAPEGWYATARRVVKELARSCNPEFTSDDVWHHLEALGVGAPPEPRALGAVFRAAQRDGLIKPTSRYVPSDRPGRHRGPIRVWEPAAADAIAVQQDRILQAQVDAQTEIQERTADSDHLFPLPPPETAAGRGLAA